MTRFSFTRALLTGAVTASVALASAGAFAQNDLKIGVVSLERILRDAKVAQIASDRLNAEGRQRQDEIEAMTRSERVAERRALAETERDITRRNREARDEFNQRRNEEVMLLQSRAARVVQDIAKAEKFDLVLYEYFYASDRVDLTKRVIDILDKDVADGKKTTK